MSIKKAEPADFPTVKNIVQTTIAAVYPHYYPAGAVSFFAAHHNDANIMNDIEAERVYICRSANGEAVGTVTVKANEICRLFVLPGYQGKGYGRELLDFAEAVISAKYDEIRLDSSLPAKAVYKKRGYRDVEYHIIRTDSGDYLCYDIMTRRVNGET